MRKQGVDRTQSLSPVYLDARSANKYRELFGYLAALLVRALRNPTQPTLCGRTIMAGLAIAAVNRHNDVKNVLNIRGSHHELLDTPVKFISRVSPPRKSAPCKVEENQDSSFHNEG
jgi:hypothetical protein